MVTVGVGSLFFLLDALGYRVCGRVAQFSTPPCSAVSAVETKLREYRLLGGIYPSQEQGLAALVTRPTTDPMPKRYSQLYSEVPLDPWHNEFKYLYPGRKNSNKPEIISAGPDGVFGTKDDLSN